jgi:glyoxylase-like metal-dependent hydrolase (beta-lactamase superfamily II)
VFGDGSVVCLPTHGHTPGHRSLRVRLAGGDVVLAADACYFCRTLRERRLPRYVHDREAMLASLDRLVALEGAGARIFFGHDPEFWKSCRKLLIGSYELAATDRDRFEADRVSPPSSRK